MRVCVCACGYVCCIINHRMTLSKLHRIHDRF